MDINRDKRANITRDNVLNGTDKGYTSLKFDCKRDAKTKKYWLIVTTDGRGGDERETRED